MKRLRVLAALFGMSLIVGCGTPKALYWYQTGKSSEDTRRDLAACQAEAARINNPLAMVNLKFWYDNKANKKDFIQNCMVAKGYSLVENAGGASIESKSESQAEELSAEAAGYFKNLDMDKIRAGAARGDPEAQVNLGLAYSTGYGVPLNYSEAILWFQKAADQDFAFGWNALAAMYEGGIGVQKDDVKAVGLFLKAATLGNAPAQTSLGFKYANGVGVSQNFIEAYKWWNLAAAHGDSTALENRERLTKRMTPEQVAEGQKRSAEFTPRVAK